MNTTLIKYAIKKIFEQPLAKLLILLELLILGLILFSSMEFSGGALTYIKISGIELVEPYLIKDIIASFSTFILLAVNFTVILISSRFFSEEYKNRMLEIVLPKLSKKEDFIYSTFSGGVIFFLINFFLFLTIAASIYYIKSGIFFVGEIYSFYILVVINLLFISGFSALLTLMIDGFSASLFLIVPLMVEFVMPGILYSNEILIEILPIIFPLNKEGLYFKTIIEGTPAFPDIVFVNLIIVVTVAFITGTLFRKRWE